MFHYKSVHLNVNLTSSKQLNKYTLKRVCVHKHTFTHSLTDPSSDSPTCAYKNSPASSQWWILQVRKETYNYSAYKYLLVGGRLNQRWVIFLCAPQKRDRTHEYRQRCNWIFHTPQGLLSMLLLRWFCLLVYDESCNARIIFESVDIDNESEFKYTQTSTSHTLTP